MRLGVMCSGNGTNFENIITNPICNKHEVVLMIHNTKQCGAVKRAAKFGIPQVRDPHKDEDNLGQTSFECGRRNNALKFRCKNSIKDFKRWFL